MPTVNPSGMGRNVYYSDSDLVALTVMEYLLSIGLSFELCQHVLRILKARESWMFDESVAKEEMKRLMLVPNSQEQLRDLVHLIEPHHTNVFWDRVDGLCRILESASAVS